MRFFEKRKRDASIKVDREFIKNGVLFQVYLIDGKQEIPLTFPLQNVPVALLLQSEARSTIAALEMLYEEDQLTPYDRGWLFPYAFFYNEDNEEFSELLELPTQPSPISVELDSSGIAGTPSFNFHIVLEHRDFGQLHRFARRTGPLLTLQDGMMLLLEPAVYELLTAIDNKPLSEDVTAHLQYVAEVKHKAEIAGARLTDYLKRENYVFIDSMEIDAILEDVDHISLHPKYSHFDSMIDPLLTDLASGAKSYGALGGQDRKRVFITPKIVEQNKQVRQIPPIVGADVPRFVQNPGAFVSEEIELDLEQFGERVKNLGVRVYRTQVGFNGTENGTNNWFTFEPTINLVDSSTGDINAEDSMGMEEFRRLVNEARGKNEEYVFYNGQWIQIPHHADGFIDAVDKIDNITHKGQGIDPTKLPYVLEIFTNLNQIEFNQPIHELKASMLDSGVMDSPPNMFKADLYPYQIEGFRWMKLLDFRGLGGLLADDMGLGKTVQVIAFISYLKSVDRLAPSLIVAPLTLLDNWRNEIGKFFPSLDRNAIYIHQGSNRLKQVKLIKEYDIVLTSYDTLVRDQLLLGQIDWKCTICDEAQKIKNSTTATSTVVKALKNEFRLALTGTPVENGLVELWSIIDFVQPGLLGSLKSFKEQYEKPLQSSQTAEVENKLLGTIQPVYKRRTKREHLSDVLPEKQVSIRHIPLGPEQAALYWQVIHEVKSKSLNGLEAIHALRQVCSHPGLFQSGYENLDIKRVPKLAETISILQDVRKHGEKALIFTDYKKMQRILSEAIAKEFGFFPRIINGESSHRQDIVNVFNQSEGFNVMLLSPKAAGVGLTITGANHVIHYTRWWNPAVENQSTDRVYRIGQKKNVTVYYPIVTSPDGKTMEQVLDELLAQKQNLAENIIVPSQRLDCQDELLMELQKHG